MLVKYAVSNLVVSLILAWYVGMDRLERYVRWAASDPDFFRIPVCLGKYNIRSGLLSDKLWSF